MSTVSNQSTYQISHVIVPDMVFPNDSLIFDEILCKSEENTLNEPSHDRKPDVVSIDADFSNGRLLCNDILNKCEESSSEEQNPDVLSDIICPHNAFVLCGKLVQCDARVLNELDFNYNPDDVISNVIHPYHKNTSNVYSNQCKKYVLNEATLFRTRRYKDPTLFRGRRMVLENLCCEFSISMTLVHTIDMLIKYNSRNQIIQRFHPIKCRTDTG
ncbi:unnamed protein product [Schistosoma mattheei]|uniref:Uncharacterized protein n=1 Tax=Schistosoma mattheei TaxID=31246 RepID=A0A183NZM1_9TREM|nr:unnamed protein product [Schistosoma mattheei]